LATTANGDCIAGTLPLAPSNLEGELVTTANGGCIAGTLHLAPSNLKGEPQNEKSPPGILKEGSLVGRER